MAYTEIRKKNNKNYYYRVLSIRKNIKVSKKRVYLGVDLTKEKIRIKEAKADIILNSNKNEPMAVRRIKYKIIEILKKYDIKEAGIFGSYARGENKKSSDIDILIQPPKGMGLEFIGVQLELESRLKRKVDLITYKGIHPLIKKQVLKEEIKILWKEAWNYLYMTLQKELKI